MITIWVPKRLVEIDLYNIAARSPEALAEMSERSYRERVRYAAEKVRFSGTKIVMLTGPSASGKTTSAHKLAEELIRQGTPAHVVSLDNFFRGAEFYPRMPDGTLDYENPDTMDLPLIRQCLRELSETGKTVLPIYDFTSEKRSDATEPVDLQGGVCIVEGIHALNPELTSLVPGEEVYRIYAGLREEYCIDGRRVINTQDIRLCRRTLRDAAARGRSPEKTLAMWDRVLDGETRYIKGFKTTADFLLDTSFTYEMGLIAQLLQKVRRQFVLEGHNAELWDETARRFEHVAPLPLDLLPADSMLREFYGSEANWRRAVRSLCKCEKSVSKSARNCKTCGKFVAIRGGVRYNETIIRKHRRGSTLPLREVSIMDFNKIKEMGLEYAEKGKNAAMDLAERGKTQAKIVNEQTKLARAQRQLGALVYSLAKGNEENQPLVDKYIEMIDAIEKDLAALRESIGTPAAEAAPEPEAPADSVTIEFPIDAQPAAEEKKTCPQCGAPVSDDALFCNKCGAQL